MPVIPSEIHPNPVGVFRDDAWPQEPGPPGSSYQLMREQLLDPYRVERGLLTFGAGTYVAANPNPYFAAELARAANDWSIDHWLSDRDERLYARCSSQTSCPRKPRASCAGSAVIRGSRPA